MTQTHRTTALASLTIDSVIAWQVVIAGLILYPLFRFIGDPPYPDASPLPYVIGIVGPAAVLAVLLACVALAARLTSRHFAGVPVVLTVAAAAILAQATVPATGGVVAAARQSTPLVTIATEATLLTLLWVVTALAYVSISTYVGQARSLRAREDALEAELAALDIRGAQDQARISRDIGEIAQGALAELSSGNLEEVSAVLRSWSEDVVRPLSRDLAGGSELATQLDGKEVASPWVIAARTVTNRDPIPVLLITAVALAASPGLLFRTYSPATAALALAGVASLTALGAAFVNIATRPLLPKVSVPWRMVVIYVACLPLAFAELLPFTVPALLGMGQSQTGQSLSALWLGPGVSPIFVLCIVWLRIAFTAGDESLSMAQTRTRDLAIQVAALNLYLRQRRKAWAHALHGQVQSAMLAASIRLDREFRGGSLDEEAVERACRPVWQALEAAQAASVDPHSWDEAMGLLHSLWDGLIDLRIHVDSRAEAIIDEVGLCRSGAIDVLTESISNAVRHGHASQVLVDIAPGEESTLVVCVSDNGGPVNRDRPQGLGSALLDEISVNWSLVRSMERNHLTVELPALHLTVAERQPSDIA